MFDPRKRLDVLADSFTDAILVTHGEGGELHGRPMLVAAHDEPGTIWLVTSASSPKTIEIAHDARAMLTMQARARFVTLTGTARVVRDEGKAADLWTPAWRAWFRDPKDPDLVLIRLTVTEGAYWDRRGMRAVRATMQMARGMISKGADRPEADVRQHARVDLT